MNCFFFGRKWAQQYNSKSIVIRVWVQFLAIRQKEMYKKLHLILGKRRRLKRTTCTAHCHTPLRTYVYPQSQSQSQSHHYISQGHILAALRKTCGTLVRIYVLKSPGRGKGTLVESSTDTIPLCSYAITVKQQYAQYAVYIV